MTPPMPDDEITEILDPGQIAALELEGRQRAAAAHSEHQLFDAPLPSPPAGYDLGQLTWLRQVERIGRPGWRGE